MATNLKLRQLLVLAYTIEECYVLTFQRKYLLNFRSAQDQEFDTFEFKRIVT